jgi:multidrug resistance efflux pump
MNEKKSGFGLTYARTEKASVRASEGYHEREILNKKQEKFPVHGIKIAGAVFFVLLFTMIFLSKTIYTYNLPEVTGAKPMTGKLTKTERAKGVADYADVAELYNTLTGSVSEVFVAEGDRVVKGQPLFNMVYDREDAQKKLDECAISKEKLALDIENIYLNIKRLEYNTALLQGEVYEPAVVSTGDLPPILDEIKKAEAAYENQKILYEAGVIAKQELENNMSDIEALYIKYEKQIDSIKEAEEKAAIEADDKEKARDKQLKGYEYDMQGLRQDLKAKEIERKNIILQEETLLKTLADFMENEIIRSPYDGIIVKLSAREGLRLSAFDETARFALNDAYKIEFDISQENTFIAAGDKCKLSNANRRLESQVKRITPHEKGKTVTIMINGDFLTAGESFDVLIEKESAQRYTLVPNGAVNKDSDGYFIYEIKRRDGMLGKEYYASKRKVEVGDSDASNTAIIQSTMMFFEPLVALSDKPFRDNATVKINNERDFFEN